MLSPSQQELPMSIIHFPDSGDTVQMDRTAAGVYVARLILDDGETSPEYGTGDTEMSAIADLVEALAGE
jgi:hypothetical protein